MYKDVWKRILALAVAVCMIGTSVCWPETVSAAETTKQYHTYQHGAGSTTGWLDANTAAAVFTVGQNAKGEAEILDSISFSAHIKEEGKATGAAVSYYLNPQAGRPDSGEFVHTKTITDLKEGLNTVEAGMETRELQAGTTLAVVVSLTGASLSCYGGAQAGQTYVQQGADWKDAGAQGQCAAIFAYTYNVGDNGADGKPWLSDAMASVLQADRADTVGDAAPVVSSSAQLNKEKMVLPVGSFGQITLNDAIGEVKWSVGDSSIAEVKAAGKSDATVAGIKAGETTITAKDGDASYTCQLKVTASLADATVSLTPEQVVYDGARHLPALKVKIGETVLEADKDYQITCARVDAQGATGTSVDMQDPESFKNAGAYRFQVIGQGQYGGTEVFADYVIAPKQIADASVTVDLQPWNPQDALSYIGTIKDTARNSVVLTKGDASNGDYYLEEVKNEAGVTLGINILGRGNYEGVRYCAVPQSIAGAAVTFDSGVFVYTGREWQPEVSVAVEGVILSASDYTVAYSNNLNAGTATATITGQNSYYGTITKEFEILQKDLSNADADKIQTPVESLVSNAVGNANPDIEVTYNGMTLKDGTDYDITFTPNAAAGTGECVIKGKGNYTGTRTDNYRIVSGDITAHADEVAVSDMVYTGKELKPAVTLKKAGKVVDSLQEGRDYTVTYAGNTNVGTATVTVHGKGAYGGKLTGSFQITAADLAQMSYQFKDATGSAAAITDYKVDYSLQAGAMKPGVIVTNGAAVLREGVDYKLTYTLDTMAEGADLSGGLQVTVHPADGNTNYTGSRVLPYTVSKCNLKTAITDGNINLTLDKDSFNYTGKAQKPVPTLVYTSGETLQKDRDYTVAYSNDAPTEVGDYKVMITGKGNYTGYVEKAFRITNIDIETIGDIQADPAQEGLVEDYTGQWLAMKWYDDGAKEKNKLKLIVTDNSGNKLKEGTDYQLVYKNIDAVSTRERYAQVTVQGRGKYTGERVVYYLLAGKLEDYELSVKDVPYVYTGEAITLAEENVTVKTGILFWKNELVQGVDYELSYENNKNAGTAKVVVKPVEDAKLPTQNGCYRYTKGLAEDKKLQALFNIRPQKIDAEDVQLKNAIVKEYKGKAVELTTDDIPLIYNGMELSANDFEVVAGSHTDNTSPSSNASVTVRGKGNYENTRVISFVINGKSLAGVQAEVASAIYTGEKLYPEIQSLTTKDGIALQKGTDYEYSRDDYQKNVNAGEGTITIHGKGEYLGSTAEIRFTIQPRDLRTAKDTCTIEGVSSAGYTYTSQAIEPKVTVKYQVENAAARILKPEADYMLSYRDNTSCAKRATVVVTGKGNYTGTVEKEFTIVPKNIAETESDISVAPIAPQEYNGGIAVTPIPDISYQYGSGETEVYRLTADDYTLAYQGQNKLGTATITVTGKGNFTGTRTVEYHIGNSINDANKVAIRCPEVEAGTHFVYTGSAYKPEVKVTNQTTGSSLEKEKDYTVIYENNTDAGTATITVLGKGVYAGEKKFTFVIEPKKLADADVRLAIEGKTDGSYQTEYTGKPVEPKITLTYNGKTYDTGYTVDYGADHTAVGTVRIAVTAAAGGNFTGTKDISNDAAAKFEIVQASIGSGGSIPAEGFKLEVVEPQPIGSDGTARPTPKLYHQGRVLAAGIDYTYSYEKNNAIGSDAVVVLTGIGNYTGSVRQKFEIRGSIAGAAVEVAGEIWYKEFVKENPGNKDMPYTLPDEITFDDKITVTLDGKTLVKGQDYEISYTKNTWVGIAAVTIKGTGKYAGTVTKEVPIRADLSETTITVGDQKYTGSPVKAVPIVEYYGKALREGEDFLIHSYANNTEITDKASVTIIGNDKNGFYGTETAEFRITVDTGALTVSGVEANYLYRGTAIEPEITVGFGDVLLTPADYEVTYGSNTNAGKGTVVVKGKGAYAGFVSDSIIFDILPQDIRSLTILDGKSNVIADREYTGLPILPELTAIAKAGAQTYTLPTSDYRVEATTDNTAAGDVTLKLTGTGNVTGSREMTFTIVPKSLSKPTAGADTISMQVTQDTFGYDGTAKTPEVIVTYQYGTETQIRTLEKDKDYTVGYSNNIAVGTAHVTVTGMGNYTGARTGDFTITAQDISAAAVTFPNGSKYPYMGSTVEVKPEVAVTLKDVRLTEGKDYTLSYQDNTACGTATVTVTGTGDFGGKAVATFTIEPHSINAADIVVAPIPNQGYTGAPIEPEVKITCGDYRLVKGLEYELTCSGNTQIGQASVKIQGIGGFKDSRTALFTIASSIEKAEVSGLKDSYPYTGQVLTAEQLGITEVRIGEKILGDGDYTVGFAEGSDGISVGTQTVVLIGTGNYGGTKEIAITITPKNIADTDIVLEGFLEKLPYAEEPKQEIALQWNGTALQEKVDYEVSYRPAELPSTYMMTVTGKGNYTGVIEKSFAVERPASDALVIKEISSNYTYTGEPITPKPLVLLGDTELKEGTDYTLTYLNNQDAGTATLRITGTGTYFTGERELTFLILRRSINHGTVGEIATQVYTGREIKPAVTVTDGGKTLGESAEYTLMYKNNRRTGTGSVIVAGMGNYTSTKTIPFAIRPCGILAPAVLGVSQTTVSLNWAGEGVVTGYEIYRMEAGGKWQYVGGTKATTYMDAKLAAGTAYSYKIRSYVVEEGETYYGEYSSIVTAATTK